MINANPPPPNIRIFFRAAIEIKKTNSHKYCKDIKVSIGHLLGSYEYNLDV